VIIEQAKGVLAQQGKLSMDVAFARLRHYARGNNQRLTEVARRVIDTDFASEVLTPRVGGAYRRSRRSRGAG